MKLSLSEYWNFSFSYHGGSHYITAKFEYVECDTQNTIECWVYFLIYRERKETQVAVNRWG